MIDDIFCKLNYWLNELLDLSITFYPLMRSL